MAWANSVPAAPRSALGKALHYLREQWPYLVRYLEDGWLELSNNRAERSIKPFVMGWKSLAVFQCPSGRPGQLGAGTGSKLFMTDRGWAEYLTPDIVSSWALDAVRGDNGRNT